MGTFIKLQTLVIYKMANNNGEYINKLQLAQENLDRIIHWIQNSDSKATVINAFQVGLTVFLINKSPDIIKIIKNSPFGWFQFLLYFTIILFAFFLIKSVFECFSALYPNIEPKESSMFYFACIAKYGQQKFIKEFRELNDKETLDQINSQAYINSQIALKKFENVRKSIQSIYISGIFWIIVLVLTSTLV